MIYKQVLTSVTYSSFSFISAAKFRAETNNRGEELIHVFKNKCTLLRYIKFLTLNYWIVIRPPQNETFILITNLKALKYPEENLNNPVTTNCDLTKCTDSFFVFCSWGSTWEHQSYMTKLACLLPSLSQIAYLENLLKLYNDEICRLQQAELSLDDLAAEDSLYIQEHRLKRKVRL